jgi:hypothetical protein
VGSRFILDVVAKKKNFLTPCRGSNRDHPARSLLTPLTELYRLHKLSFNSLNFIRRIGFCVRMQRRSSISGTPEDGKRSSFRNIAFSCV